ncbi:MAG: hypothetical protein OXT71_14470 [Acidobacteriota bacterium]|nr:hypothetical protein [Acidobacteriota bacterium]
MPYEINLENPPAGYAITPARAGECVKYCIREFTSTEDGQHFIQRLEGGPSIILQRLPTEIRPSSVDNMLVIYGRDGKATVYVNELELKAAIRAARSVKAGGVVLKDHIADVELLDLGVEVPDNAGFLFIFSIGWRKGLFYDLGPLGPNREPRIYDIAAILGQAYCQVLFQERFSISDLEWDRLLKAKWFPFVGLTNKTIEELVSHVRSGWDPDEKLDDIVSEVRGRSAKMLNIWRENPSLVEHIEILERAVERFQNDDPMSCTSLLFPRIEGILRTHHNSLGAANQPSPQNLSASAVATEIDREKCLLLPHRFNIYLDRVYFADFDPSTPNIEVSRHSVGHGVASESEFNRKSAAIGILIVHQLSYFLQTGKGDRLKMLRKTDSTKTR